MASFMAKPMPYWMSRLTSIFCLMTCCSSVFVKFGLIGVLNGGLGICEATCSSTFDGPKCRCYIMLLCQLLNRSKILRYAPNKLLTVLFQRSWMRNC